MTHESAWYDLEYSDKAHRAHRPLELSPRRKLYEAAADRVPDWASVVDLGCGTGRFARLMWQRPYGTIGYIGLDFSRVAVEEARRYCPGMDFRVVDLRTFELPFAHCYVCLEVLEHLADDLALLERIPSGATVVLSVPSYESESHVRWFPSAGDVWERYGGIFARRNATRDTVRLAPGRFIYLLAGTKR